MNTGIPSKHGDRTTIFRQHPHTIMNEFYRFSFEYCNFTDMDSDNLSRIQPGYLSPKSCNLRSGSGIVPLHPSPLPGLQCVTYVIVLHVNCNRQSV